MKGNGNEKIEMSINPDQTAELLSLNWVFYPLLMSICSDSFDKHVALSLHGSILVMQINSVPCSIS